MGRESRADLRERGDWFVAQVRAQGESASIGGLEAHVPVGGERTVEWYRGVFQWWSQNLGTAFTVDDVEETGDSELRWQLTGSNGRRWIARFALEPDEPWRLAVFCLERRLPDGVEVRDAVAGDGPAIVELYRSTPMQAGDLRVTIDPGEDYFALTRLMEESQTLVATDPDGVIGVYCATRYAGRLNGADVSILLGCHSRMAAGKAGGGVWSNMNRTLIDRFEGRFDVPLAFVLVGNVAASRLTSAGAWPAHPVRAVVRCTADAPSFGRPATPDDNDEVVAVLNATHHQQDLFRPYTAVSLAARLERAPDLYGWDDLWLGDGAVVGVGRTLQGRITEGPDGRTESIRALVLDHGFLPGRDDAYRALLAACGGDAARRGASRLSVFTTEPARTYPALRAVADAMEAYDVLIPGQTPEDDAADRGLYVDQVHF